MLYSIVFLHQTTTRLMSMMLNSRCILLFSYIKPQQTAEYLMNINVVFYCFPTSNHNKALLCKHSATLYSIVFLHQTTTSVKEWLTRYGCILLFSYIKPQLAQVPCTPLSGCILLFSYIKPQPEHFFLKIRHVVFYCFPTSNHNVIYGLFFFIKLYSIVFLHQTTTHTTKDGQRISCILLFSYIKPQPSPFMLTTSEVVFYCFPTSNHNRTYSASMRRTVVFYCFPTSNHNKNFCSIAAIGLYSIVFLHQTTTYHRNHTHPICCILLFSYIKPQPSVTTNTNTLVVFYCFPTSNHNRA